jgi:phosphohistidine phosphatase SixA
LVTLQIYLIQHAKSKSKEEDPARRLTDEGRRTVEGVEEYLARNWPEAISETTSKRQTEVHAA